MLKIAACIFDLDGVIVDTAKYHYLSWRKLANYLGFDFSLEANEKLKGVSRMDSLNILLEIGGLSINESEKKKFANLKNYWYLEYISQMKENEILPGVKEFIATQKSRGIKIALGSASKNAVMVLENLNIYSLFDTIIDGNKVNNAKPHPEVFLLAAKNLSLEPSQCLVFEDAQAGVKAAKRAGMLCVGVTSHSFLEDADFIITGFEDTNNSINELFI